MVKTRKKNSELMRKKRRNFREDLAKKKESEDTAED